MERKGLLGDVAGEADDRAEPEFSGEALQGWAQSPAAADYAREAAAPPEGIERVQQRVESHPRLEIANRQQDRGAGREAVQALGQCDQREVGTALTVDFRGDVA